MDIRTHNDLRLDGTKIGLYPKRVRDWAGGQRIAPITVDMALTRSCNMRCVYCYGQLQENERKVITADVITRTMKDFGDIGVKGVSLVSDGESTCSPHLGHAIKQARDNNLAIALGTNGLALTEHQIYDILPSLSYLRFNISAGEEERYNQIMRPRSKDAFKRVISNIKYAVQYKKDCSSWVRSTIGMQMVLMPEFEDQIIPLSKLAVNLGVDYLVIKHCSDDEDGSLGVDYSKYATLKYTLETAECLSIPPTRIVVKWNKLRDGNVRSYQQCYGPPFHIQLSGSGLVAPCGMFFAEKYKEYHIGNIVDTPFRQIWESERYWEVMHKLASPQFNAQTVCGCLCLQHMTNKALDDLFKGSSLPDCPPDIAHKEFL